MSTATVHRRKLSGYRYRPSERFHSEAETPLSAPSPCASPQGAARPQDTGQARRPVRAASLHPARRRREQLRSRPRHPRADRPRRASDAHAVMARLPRLCLEPSAAFRAEGPGARSHDAGPPRAASGDFRGGPRPWCCSLWRFWPIGGCCRRLRRPTRPTPPLMRAPPRARPWTGGSRA